MPTGYTAPVVDGKITEFKDFALSCARAFGALVTMRDDPSDATIPDEIPPNPYHKNQRVEAHVRLRELLDMTPDQAIEAAKLHHQDKVERNRKYQSEQAEQNTRVQAMLDRVKAWTPPSDEHLELKVFMIQQLKMSFQDYDYGADTIVPDDGPTWLAAQLESVNHDIKYHTREWDEEVWRATGRTAWLKALRASLEPANGPT